MVLNEKPLNRVLWLLVAFWTTGTSLALLAPGTIAAEIASQLSVLWLFAFAFLHGSRRYGYRGITAFLLISAGGWHLLELTSIHFGFPFGYYVHNAAMGPKIGVVPAIIAPTMFAYLYLAWTLANGLVGEPRRTGELLWGSACAVVAMFIVVCIDLCVDPPSSIVRKLWTFREGGPFFGIPMTNYIGWFISSWAIFQIFAIYLASSRWFPPRLSSDYWYSAALFWGMLGLQFPVDALLNSASSPVADSNHWMWRRGDILGSAALMSICTMIASAFSMAVIVWRRETAAGLGGDPAKPLKS